jgi:hypothetical protein
MDFRRQKLVRRRIHMGNPISLMPVTSGLADVSGKNEADKPGVSWGAVVAGAFVAAALSLILLALGTGIGLSSVSLSR